MMMMGEGGRHLHRDPTVHAPPWSPFDDPTGGYGGGECSPYVMGGGAAALAAALQGYAAVAAAAAAAAGEEEEEEELLDEAELADAPVDAFSCDEFRMYEFKVRRCARGRSHDWTECPYAHPGEKARRRDPRKYHYSGTACPDFRKGNCKRGDACEFAHGVFECWLHPARYRTQPCKDGTACRRRVCFFAHTPEQLRLLPQQQQQQQQHQQHQQQLLLASPRGSCSASSAPPPESYDGSPLRRRALESSLSKGLASSSPTSTLLSPPLSPPSESPPISPSGSAAAAAALRRASWPVAGASMNELAASFRTMQLSKVKSAPSSCGFQLGGAFGSPRGSAGGFGGGFWSLPSTPTKESAVGGGLIAGFGDGAELGLVGEEPPVQRVESGRALRAKMFERLSKDCAVAKSDTPTPTPDVAWISELVK
ncbi:zinc finger CCCH domain-containing protein 2-like [Ananas comosus]|uniref:Zinc finger CCCH domain-containing protein 2 n=1 Tax=Ananas comosus TaxID=4615 RepID=A0A199W525_ANACO|nr:zinc finger CCCH domain-containing protein 2-like [Ananas comosus]OAY84414.1 Zinc finger CCCH domain-containing protein 2 [Ananas comosus]